MQKLISVIILIGLGAMFFSCARPRTAGAPPKILSAKDILGNPLYAAISYGGYRHLSREIQPTIPELKEDMKILYAMGFKVLRTYNAQFAEAENVLKAITEIKNEDASFEMYVMLGAWIDCKNAWTNTPIHNEESDQNKDEISRVAALAKKYPDIVKMIAVGNESMVRWATSYFVSPDIILKWVNHIQELKKKGELNKDLWVTSSDNFASWGGGGGEYHVPALNQLIQAVDFISMHTYPMHDTHYNPDFWGVPAGEKDNTDIKKIDDAMLRAKVYAQSQYEGVWKYVKSIQENKPIHIGETGWASVSNEHYGDTGSRATDEYKAGLFYKHMRQWTKQKGLTCFYFEAFDEQWKNADNPQSSENHFGLIDLNGQAKYAVWEMVEGGVFKGLTRGGKKITRTYDGKKDSLMQDVKVPPSKSKIKTSN